MDSVNSQQKPKPLWDQPGYIEDIYDPETGAIYGQIPDDIFETLPLKLKENVGSGSSAEILAVQHKELPGTYMAAKVFSFDDKKKYEKRWESFLRETSVLQEVKHANIVRFCGAISCPAYAVILMSYFPQGSLFRHIDYLDQKLIPRYFIQIACALRFMHTKRFIHRDVKLDNILLRSGHNAVLSDFGLSVKLSDDSPLVSGYVGTPMYMAPEVEAATKTTYYDGYKADSYATGVLLWSLLMKDEPDDILDEEEDDEVDLWATLDKEDKNVVLKECVRCMLKSDPQERWNVVHTLEYLNLCGYETWKMDMPLP